MLFRRITRFCCLLMPLFSLCLASAPMTHASTVANTRYTRSSISDFPVVDPNYIYDQLFYMVTHFQRREAGYDNNLPVNINGHDEFAAYWSQEMLHDLQGFGPTVRRDPFPAQGWRGRPATVAAFNVEVTVPGITHPEQVVVIGCHYDGEASSTQSANDDGSGCAIELGVAKAIADYWRGHGTYPARTLRFVIFDAEEQGLFGSFHYVNSTVNGDTRNIVAMFNEEQNGIAYPLRYLGKLSNPLMPFYIDLSPLQNNGLYQHQDQLSQQQKETIARFRALMQQAVSAAFAQFQALGYQMLSYHAASGQDVFQPIFTPGHLSYIHQEDDFLGGSDQIPFTLAGLPCATLVGNSSYYEQNAPQGSYPFDQPQDTIQLMNTFADGSSQKSNALTLALALPGMLTTWMLNQPDILGQVMADGNPITALGDIGQLQPKKNIAFEAIPAFNPENSGATYTYSWNFGDGTTAGGMTVSHTYTAAGNYTLTLTVSSSTGGKRQVSKLISVETNTANYGNPYASDQQDGYPPPNPSVILPTPDDKLADKVTTTAHGAAVAATATAAAASSSPSIAVNTTNATQLLIAGAALLIAFLIIVMLVAALRRKPRV